jgi:hypothetical protein
MKVRSWFFALALTAGVSAPAVGPAATACAQEGNHAALVVDIGEDRRAEPFALCVDLGDEESVSGLDLIKLASDQHGLQYRFGYGNKAVCQLANVPQETPPEECFEGAQEFWGYWIGDGSGGWSTSPQGAGSTRVEDGDVQGWSYGPGRDASTHPKPRDRADGSEFTFESICAAEASDPSGGENENEDGNGDQVAGSPQDTTDGTIPGTGGDDSGGPKPDDGASLPPLATPEPEPDERLIDSAPDVSELELAPTPTPSLNGLPASATTDGSDGGSQPPVAGVLALLITAGMAGTAFYLVRKRTLEPED